MNYKDNFENIEVPMEADLVIERAIKRAKTRHKRRVLKAFSGIAAVFILSIFLSKTSPAFAEYINSVTAPVKNLFSNFNDKGIDNAIKNGFVQEASKDKETSNQSASDNGITVSIDQITISGNKLNIGYTLKADDRYKDLENLYYDKFKITDNKGRVMYDLVNYDKPSFYSGYSHRYINEENFKNTRVKQGIFEFGTPKSKIDEIPDSITIEFYDFSDNSSGYRYKKYHGFFYRLTHKSPKIIDGNWSITIKIDDKIKNAQEIKYVKAQETDENSSAKIEYVNIYPTTANAKISLPENMRITNIYLEDDKGIKYKQSGGRGYSSSSDKSGNYNVSLPDFESPYFDKIEKLYLIFDATENGKNKNFKIELKKQ
ncbi:MAG: DUF4179 domain-containing protein [Clostridiaceae bacterium]|nr:DUF4179 domain-containing protein [Clostridiaceae bacterium]